MKVLSENEATPDESALQEEVKRLQEQLRVERDWRQRLEARLSHDELHDRLTGLPNRAKAIEGIDAAIARQRAEPGHRYALLHIDIDDFKLINDSLGHEAGDELLVALAGRLRRAVQSAEDGPFALCEGMACRLGGDEFVVLLEGLCGPEEATRAAALLHEVLSAGIEVQEKMVVVHASIGIAHCLASHCRATDLVRDADTALFTAKKQGKHRTAVFDDRMHVDAQERFEMEADLRAALVDTGEGSQLHLMYQPIVSLATGRIAGFEALLRWRHPRHGMVPPTRFVPVADSSGLIVPIGELVLRAVCGQVMKWREIQNGEGGAKGASELWVSVNVADAQLQQPNFADRVDAIIDDCGVDRGALKLEVTETVVMARGDRVFWMLQQLKERGYRLALDDFGTGYSSLSYLHQIPVGCVKIDQSFVRRMVAECRPSSATVQAVVSLAHNCGMRVVGEGVETFEQVVQLQALECDMAQGYWFSRPMLTAEVGQLLRENTASPLWNGAAAGECVVGAAVG